MSAKIGIRHEDKYYMEHRTPLSPKHIETLVKDHDLKFVIQSSKKRVFTDSEYKKAGAIISKSLSDCPIIMGVKEIPEEAFEPKKTYIFFSHVIKGQDYNMPMLKKMIELKCNLIDYEKVSDQDNKRLIFFGRHAGLAGMINSLWSLGQRLYLQGYKDNPFINIKQSHKYDSLQDASKAIKDAGKQILEKGIQPRFAPLTIGITGYGNVSKGAQEIIDMLPVKEVTPKELLTLKEETPSNADYQVFKVIFKEQHISKPKDTSVKFDLQDYYNSPENYENNFEQYIPHLTVLMNCMYWDDRYPRIFTKDYAFKLWRAGDPKIMVIGDVTCDPDGSIELTHKGTAIEDPVFVYNPRTGAASMGFHGDGILMMAVDILPSELPRDSSEAFGDALLEFIKPIADANYAGSFNDLNLPDPVKKAMILHKGKLTPDYEYIQQYLD
jgi:alpha-aminoadipic semialdehyde synthase